MPVSHAGASSERLDDRPPLKRLEVERILFVCSANICRSPMAVKFLQSRLETVPHVEVKSAGFLHSGRPVAREVLGTMRRWGLDLSSHLSSSVDAAIETSPDLILVMTRQHLRSLVDLDGRLFPRTFTLKEFVRLAEVEGHRAGQEDIETYVRRVSAGRTFSALLSPDDSDIADPIGRRKKAYDRCAEEIETHTSSIATLLYPEHSREPTNPPASGPASSEWIS